MTRSEPHWLDLRPWPRVGYTLVEVTGSLGITTYPVLRDGLLKIATEAPEAVVVDIDGVEVLDSALLSVFTFVATRVGDWPGVPFSLVVSRPDHLALMHRRSIDRFVTVCETVDAARRSLDKPVRHRSGLRLPHEEATSAAARQFTEGRCAEWHVPEFRDDALVIVTELVENTIRHTTSDARVRLELRRGLFTVAVADDDPRPAVLHERTSTLEHGLGLHLVAGSAKAWGSSPVWGGGKIVWAVLPSRTWPTRSWRAR